MQKTFTKIIGLLLCFGGLIYSDALCQTNGSFEEWSPSGSPPPFNWMFPTGWTTTNATTEFTSAGVSRSTDEHSGTYAAQIKTVNVFGTLQPSQLALGDCMIDYPTYSVKAFTGGESLAALPQAFSFWYKLTTDDPTDRAKVDFLVKRGSGSSSPDTVYHTSLLLAPSDNYTEISQLIPDIEISIETDSIVFLFSSNDSSTTGSNFLFIDDVAVDFSTGTSSANEQDESISMYPNPARSEESVSIKAQGRNLDHLRIIDAIGKPCEMIYEKNGDIYMLRPSKPGIYYVASEGKCISKLVVLD